jgi:hypothetical protein
MIGLFDYILLLITTGYPGFYGFAGFTLFENEFT